jgi:hypothetical protein
VNSQVLSHRCGRTRGESSAESFASDEYQNYVTGMMLIAQQASKPSLTLVATLTGSRASLSADVPTCIGESILYGRCGATLYDAFESGPQPLRRLFQK